MATGSGNNSIGGGGSRSFWSRVFSQAATILSQAATAKDEEPPEWDSHGLPANIQVLLSNLSGSKKYKLSEISLFEIITEDETQMVSLRPTGTDDLLLQMFSIQPGGIYTKAQLQEELETLNTCMMFEEIFLEAKPEPNGTLGLLIWFMENTWAPANKFRCVNVGGSIEKSRPCLLPMSVQREVSQMLMWESEVSARMLLKIRDRVQKWYLDEGYACAQVVTFEDFNMEELVCRVGEGNITEIVIRFVDKLNNVCEGKTQLSVITQQIPKELQQGQVFNNEAGKQALSNIISLKLFSSVEIRPRPDEKNKGWVIVEINLQEL